MAPRRVWRARRIFGVASGASPPPPQPGAPSPPARSGPAKRPREERKTMFETRIPPDDTTPGAWSRRRALTGLGALGAGLLAAPALLRAQPAFGSRPIEVVTHAGVGGGTDITARMMTAQAPAVLGMDFTVVNKTGGSGAAALAYAASRPKDGHALLLITQTHLITMLRSKSPPVQIEDIVGIARATEDPQFVMVRADSPLRSADELASVGQKRPLRFGITHAGSVDHVAVAGFSKAAGIQHAAVPFRGGGDIVVNVVGGNIDIGLLNFAEAEAQIRAGEVKPLMVLAASRVSSAPDVPTAKELGIDFTAATTRGFCVLKGTPEDRVAKLSDGLVKAMKTPVYQTYLSSSGQSAESVAGRAVWQAQIEDFWKQGKDALAALGIPTG
ncbi:transporter [Pseudoroseomonas aestuarii]|uniref:Transporter n=2 Tax=Teichococcus aestuarii TaxID=568898 RepID=A0A2U1V9W9_9PROT|nr:transporter [Pseudoroseomonas aestuarii]